MLYRIYEFAHHVGIHFWDIPSILVLILMVVVAIVHTRNQKKREEEFEKVMESRDNIDVAGEVEDGIYH